MFNRRIFVLNFRDEDIPKFKTDEEIAQWHQMLGRMLAYGLHNTHDEDTLSVVTGSVTDKGMETCMTYHAPIPEYQEKWPDGSTKCIGSNASLLNDTLACLTKEAAFPGKGKEIRALMDGGATMTYESVKRWVDQCYNKPSRRERVMCALNEILDGHGVEYLEAINDDHPSYDYVNMGDTYATTILMRDDGMFIVAGLGDIVEKHMNWYA